MSSPDFETRNSNLSNFQLVVIGAGPGGLTLARCAQLAGLNVSVYEKDETLLGRDQGGTLDLHPATGQWAVARAELMEEFKRVARPEVSPPDSVVFFVNLKTPSPQTPGSGSACRRQSRRSCLGFSQPRR